MTAKRLACLGAIGVFFGHGAGIAQSVPAFGDDSSMWSEDGECDDPRFVGDGMASVLLDEDRFHDATDCRTLYQSGSIVLVAGEASANAHSGALEIGDRTLPDGEYVDEYSFSARSGQIAAIDLRSVDFDTYLFVVAPGGAQQDNDDFEGDQSHSSLTWTIEKSGTYKVYVTSYEAGESGSYSLEMDVMDAVAIANREERGALTQSDTMLESGEYYDSYSFIADGDSRIQIDLRSNDFDTYLIVVPPEGDQLENDDADSTSHSAVELAAGAFGQYRVLVTSYEQGETGDYLLTITQAADGDHSSIDAAPPPRQIVVDSSTEGSLETSDSRLGDGEYSDVFSFDAQAGQAVRVELRSSEFDTYLAVMTPSDEIFQNDDFEGSTSRSVVEFVVSESGTFTVMATSYEGGETGRYELALTSVESGSLFADAALSGRIFGLFAGISDYPGKDEDLPYTADDAVRLRDALIAGAGLQEADQVTLVDEAATRDALRRAIEDIGRRARPEDTFVFFFSGHGDRVARTDGPQITDPDALDETIEMYDGAISDDELRDMLAVVEAGTSLIFLDSCFSGGFAKDLISVPGRMGLFSSEEDVTSSVAAKFQAGGYLSLFLADAIETRLADSDGDNAVSAIELSQYVYERYRADVKASAGEFVRSSGRQTGHQHLVVDRGSIGPYDILFR
ncbi:MAG: caspase family protein [Gammaproteobacteria bacterium]